LTKKDGSLFLINLKKIDEPNELSNEDIDGPSFHPAQTLATISPGARIGGSNVERILVDLIETSCEARQ